MSNMRRFQTGDTVRIDLPNESDPDHERLHALRAEVINVIEDAASEVTGDVRDDVIYRVRL